MKEKFTEEQMTLWGIINLIAGAMAVTATHFIVLLLGTPPLDVLWHGVLFFILIPFGYLYYRQYKQTKETEEE